jgi:hypothetical protein
MRRSESVLPPQRVSPVPVHYPLVLGTCTLLFVLRVLGQVLVGVGAADFLPPFAHWYSGLMPYWLLLPTQVALIVLMLKIVYDFARGDGYFVQLKSRTGIILMVLGCLYFLSMAVRYVVTMALHPELRWFTGTIPIWFHFVLAAFVFTLGHYQAWRSAAAGRKLTS